MQELKYFDDVKCIRLLSVAIVDNEYEHENGYAHEKDLIIVDMTFKRLKKINAFKQHASTLMAILQRAISYDKPFALTRKIAYYQPDLNVLPVFNEMYLPKSTEKEKYTLLMDAIFHKQTKLIHYFLQRGVDANATGVNGLTPLMAASMVDNLPAHKMLLDNGADRYRTDNMGLTSFEYLLKHHSINILFDIKDNCFPDESNWVDSKGNSRLLFWLQNGQKISADYVNCFLFNFIMKLSGIQSLEWINSKGICFTNLLKKNSFQIPQVARRVIRKKIKEIKVHFPWLCIDKPVEKLKKIAEKIQELYKSDNINKLNCYQYIEALRIFFKLVLRFPFFFGTLFDKQIRVALMRACIAKYTLINGICCLPNNKKENLSHPFLGLPTDVLNYIYKYSFSVYDDKRLNISLLYDNLIKQTNTNEESHWANRALEKEKKYLSTLNRPINNDQKEYDSEKAFILR